MTMRRIGNEWAMFDVIRVRYSGNGSRWNATMSRDGITAHGRAPFYDQEAGADGSRTAITAAWNARVRWAGKHREESRRLVPDMGDVWNAHYDETTDPDRFAVIVMCDPASAGDYLVSFVPVDHLDD